MRTKNLAGQTMIYGLSAIMPRVINYLLTPYLSYLVFTTGDFGMMNYLYAIIPFVFTILLLGMESAYFKFVGKSDGNENYQKVFNTAWTTSLVGAVLFLLVTVVFKMPLFHLINNDFDPNIIPIIGGIVAFDVACAIPFARIREQQRAMRFVWLRTISVLVNVLLVVFFYSMLPELKDCECFGWMWSDTFGIGYIFVANLVASAVTFMLLYPIFKGAKLRISPSTLKAVLVFSFPLFIGGFVGTATELIDRQFIDSMLPEAIAMSELGIYSAAVKITMLMAIFTQMYRYAAEPFFLSNIKGDDFRAKNAEATLYFFIVSMFVFLGIMLYLDLFKYIVEEKFRAGLYVIPQLLISGVLMGVYLNLSFWYKYTEKTHFAVIISIIGLAVIVVLNILLIPKIGYAGAAWAKLCGTSVMVAVSYYFNQRYYSTPYRVGRMLEYALITTVIYYVATQWVVIDNIWFGYIFKTALIVCFALYVVWRQNLLSMLNRTRQ